MELQIIPAQIEDASLLTIIAIASKNHWNYTQNQMVSWIPELIVSEDSIKNNVVYKLLEGNETVGFYMLKKSNEKFVDLEFLFLLPIWIGKGYGKLLLQHAIEKTKTLGALNIKVVSDPNAEGFYANFGFKKIANKKTNVPDRFLPTMILKF